MRDYIHVTDLADVHVRALGILGEGKGSCALNLGTCWHSQHQGAVAGEKAACSAG